MKTFESRFEAYFVALGNAEQVTIYNYFAGANIVPFIYYSEEIDEVLSGLTPRRIAHMISAGDYRPCDNWFYIDNEGTRPSCIRSIEIVPEWIEKYIPAMARYYFKQKGILTHIDQNTEILYSEGDDYAHHILDNMSLEECITMWNESASDHYCKLWEIHEVCDESWWNHIANEIGGFDLMKAVRQSAEFDTSEKWFFYDMDYGHLKSFNTKSNLIDFIGEDFFLNEITCRNN